MNARAPDLQIGSVMKVWQSTNPVCGTVFTRNMVDVTNYSKLNVNLQYNCIGPGLNNDFGILVTKSNAHQYQPLVNYFVDTSTGSPKTFDGTIALDLSSISGSVYVGIFSMMHGSHENGNNNDVNIRKIWRG